MSDFYTRLKRAATYKGIGTKQAAMAKALNMQRQAISRWKNGGEPSAESVFEIADKWGVNAKWLALGHGSMNGEGAGTLNADQRELIENFEALEPLARAMALTMVKATREAKEKETKEPKKKR